MEFLLHGHATIVVRVVGFLVMKVFAMAASIAIFFLIYWLLPNGRVPVRAVLPTAVIMGLLSEALKYAYILALPWLNFAEVVRAVFLVSELNVLGLSLGPPAADRCAPVSGGPLALAFCIAR
jgi:hypothetical protein